MTMEEKNKEEIHPKAQGNRLETLQQAIELLKNGHLSRLDEYDLVPFPEDLEDVQEYSRFFQLSDIIYAKDEDFLEKAVTILYTAYALEATVTVLLRSDGAHHRYYLGISCPIIWKNFRVILMLFIVV